MKVFLIIVAVLAVIFALICSLSATFTIIYDNKWTTKVQILWIEKDIELTKILSFILFPDKAAEKVKSKKNEDEEQDSEKDKSDKDKPEEVKNDVITITDSETGETVAEIKKEQKQEDKVKDEPKSKNPNFLKKMWDKDGIVGIMEFVSNLLETAGSAISTLIRGFHIYSLYVKIIVGGNDAADIANTYGKICKYYYPLKGIILNGMKVDNCDDMIMPDFIAPSNEYGLQLIGSLSVGALLKMLVKAGKTFVINIIKK